MGWVRWVIGGVCMAGGMLMALQSDGNTNVLVGGWIVALLGLLVITLGSKE